jgi:hypothetical protein
MLRGDPARTGALNTSGPLSAPEIAWQFRVPAHEGLFGTVVGWSRSSAAATGPRTAPCGADPAQVTIKLT